jgi:hypothetical protein
MKSEKVTKKDIQIRIITPWGVNLMYKKLENWADIDINRFMSLHYVSVRTSKDMYEKVYKFKIVPYDEN